MIHNTEHEAAAFNRMLAFFREKPRGRAITAEIAAIGQAAEDEGWTLYDSTWLDQATGAQLDQWGKVLGHARASSWSDERYRAILEAWTLILISNGTPDEVIEILRRITASATVRLWEIFPAQVHLEYMGSITTDDPEWAADIRSYLQQAVQAGVLVDPINEFDDTTARYDIAGTGYGAGTYGTRLT